jgi:hypothetical protein
MIHRNREHHYAPDRPTNNRINEYYSRHIEQLGPQERHDFDTQLEQIEDQFCDMIRGRGMQQCPARGIIAIPGTDCKGAYIFEHHEIYRLMNIMHLDEIQSMLLVVNEE